MSGIDRPPSSSNGHGSDAWWQTWRHLRVDRRSAGYCRVTFEHPPINTITAMTIAELAELVGLIEEDRDLNVVVFASANPDFYLVGYDVEHDPRRAAATWLDLLVRLARAPVVSIAALRGRVRGAGSEFALACDLRFASRENTLLGHCDGRRAEQYGYVSRTIPDARLDDAIDALAERLARFDHDAIGLAKSYVDQVNR